MKKLLVTLMALSFGLAFGAANAMKHEKPSEAVMKACTGKAAGTEVTVDGKKTKCPEAKKAEPMKEPKK
jgi:hypothetical protein